jgi:hypothetical protein
MPPRCSARPPCRSMPRPSSTSPPVAADHLDELGDIAGLVVEADGTLDQGLRLRLVRGSSGASASFSASTTPRSPPPGRSPWRDCRPSRCRPSSGRSRPIISTSSATSRVSSSKLMARSIRAFACAEMFGAPALPLDAEAEQHLAAAALLVHVARVDGSGPSPAPRSGRSGGLGDGPAGRARPPPASRRPARRGLLGLAWAVAAADGQVHEFEDDLVWRVGQLLGRRRS